MNGGSCPGAMLVFRLEVAGPRDWSIKDPCQGCAPRRAGNRPRPGNRSRSATPIRHAASYARLYRVLTMVSARRNWVGLTSRFRKAEVGALQKAWPAVK